MHSVDVFTWKYQPADCLEQPLEFLVDGQTVTLDQGTAVLRVPAHIFDADPQIRERAHAAIDACLAAALIPQFKHYELERSTRVREMPDGSKGVYIEPQTGHLRIGSSRIDLVYTQADGTIVDTKGDRLAAQKLMAERAVRHMGDETLQRLLQSMREATQHPANELVYLYDVIDRLEAQFGDRQRATAALGITRARWGRLGMLCNNEPLEQGRHRGEHDALRPATAEELEEARGIAHEMVSRYMDHLEARGP